MLEPASPTTAPDRVYDARLAHARAALIEARADWLVVPPSADFRWLTGAHARQTERLIAYAIPARGDAFIVVPRLESEALAHECPGVPLEVWDEHEDPFQRLTRRMRLEERSTVLIGEGWRVPAVLRLAAAAQCRPAAEALAPLRAVKDDAELACLAEAGRHADAIVEWAADQARPGMTERALARAITDAFAERGDSEAWAIVAAGPNAALPHHAPSDRAIRDGEALLIDCGAFTGGYASDITRTYWLGAAPEEAVRVHRIVDEARAAGIAAVGAGVPAEAVDRAARTVIERAGLGEAFTHRTGHGVGLEIHEPPYLVAGNGAPLRAGMVHSVEPGVYLPGRFGVRLEDLVVVGAEGARRLNDAPRDLRIPRLR